ncbi:cation acetate symporter [Oleiharenicola lentus]|jgi:Na+(H+)/acetate symporter ActP|uniref:Cation acetate symporter n=1 Tax=Oleiharenicola lentus TaxID=2508720 RepID=A0A4Q1C6V6_9BACT|nr:cation acetate symporter [Oleiharenicola lentus]RXK54614.1 cation acetate symporter [Oleiharenicola lentus]
MTSLLPLAFMEGVDPWIFGFSFITVVVTVWMGFRSAKTSKTASDFFVAGRSVSVGWNASAISGEYLSAASFMGVAGMVMSSGYDALWYPVCYACGYLFLLLFIAGPLRRFGAYTIPDFAEGRFDSPLFRKIAVCFVLFIGFFYTMPQMKGAGTTLAYIFPGMPYWGGVVLVGAVITLNVALGGMKGITLVQAFQYWIKMFAICVPIFVVMSVYGFYNAHLGVNDGRPVAAGEPAALVQTVERKPLSEKAPADTPWISPFGPLTTKAAKAAGLSEEQAKPYSLLYTYSLIIALVCGTAGLPHILVRFYTNPDGVAAKKTTMWVMILIGVFYVFPPVFGVIGRNLMPELYAATGAKGTDKVVLELPRVVGGVWGSILSGITCAGAFAAFMSTFSGLLVSMTGALAHDVYGRILRPNSTPQERMFMFKVSAVIIGAVAIGLGSQVEQLQINFMVGQAFAIAAASYFPLLFMSVWWRGMTMTGAATGMLGGGLAALACTTIINLSDLKLVNLADFWKANPLLRILCEQPAIWTVPLAITLMIVVSKLTAAKVPGDIRMKMLVLHAPEKLGLKQEYIQEHQAGMGH